MSRPKKIIFVQAKTELQLGLRIMQLRVWEYAQTTDVLNHHMEAALLDSITIDEVKAFRASQPDVPICYLSDCPISEERARDLYKAGVNAFLDDLLEGQDAIRTHLIWMTRRKRGPKPEHKRAKAVGANQAAKYMQEAA